MPTVILFLFNMIYELLYEFQGLNSGHQMPSKFLGGGVFKQWSLDLPFPVTSEAFKFNLILILFSTSSPWNPNLVIPLFFQVAMLKYSYIVLVLPLVDLLLLRTGSFHIIFASLALFHYY